jgi:hypothetical protein
MAHFFRPADASANAYYDVDGKLAPDSLWRVRAPYGSPVKVGVHGAAGLWVRSNNPNIVDSTNPREWIVRDDGINKQLRFSGKTVGTTIIYAGAGDAAWISMQFQSTPSDGVMPTISDPSKYFVSKLDPSSPAYRGAKIANGRLWRQELQLGGHADVGITGLTSWRSVNFVFNNPTIASTMRFDALGENLAGPDGVRLVFQITGITQGDVELVAYDAGRPFAAMQVHVSGTASTGACYVDNYQDFVYDPNYEAEGENRSTIILVRYHDDVVIPIDYRTIYDSRSASDAQRKTAIGPGGRLFPVLLNAATTPKLYAAKRQVYEILEALLFQDVEMALLDAVSQMAFYVMIFQLAAAAPVLGAFGIIGRGGVRSLLREIASLPTAFKGFFSRLTARGAVKAVFGSGTLTPAELDELQAIANKYNAELDVVGSRARGAGRNIDKPNLPVGKGENTRSDIDVVIDGQKDIDSSGGLSNDIANASNGAGKASAGLGRPWGPPYIRIRPNQPPLHVK